MSKLILVLTIIHHASVNWTCYSQSPYQKYPVNEIKDDCLQIINVEESKPILFNYPGKYQAHFPGGKDSLTAFIKRNLQWPPTIFCGQGTVYIEFIVDSSGVIKDQRILYGVCENYDKEALRIISLMPNWIPAKNLKQIATESKINLPIKFRFE